MSIGIYTSASAMVALDRWQQAISQNIASAQVPGFRRNEQAFEAKATNMERYGGDAQSVKEVRGVMPTMSSQLSFQPGEIRGTGNDTDFAIQGRGFFKIQGEKGETGYTRDGEFHINADRKLVNKGGFPVLGESGPIALRPEGGKLSVTADGSLVQGETAVGKLPVYEFNETDKLHRIAGGLIAAEDPKVVPKQVQNPEIISGVLEMSNVQPLQEMVSMITVSRAYESNQKLIMNQDELMGKAIQTLGSLSA